MVAGTDTGVGKTVFSAMLALELGARYWKPVQCGAEGGTDSQRVLRMAALAPGRVLPEAYLLRQPLSPHRAAELDGVSLDPRRLARLPSCAGRLVVELAGGLMVPLTRSVLQVDVVAGWDAPVVLCARTTLGAINHALLSVEALRRRGVELRGIAFIGEPNDDSESTIAALSGARRLGRLPMLPRLGPSQLRRAFRRNFSRDSFLRASRGAATVAALARA